MISDLRFLIVEDHGFQRWTLGHYLEQLGAKVIFNAGDGQTALEIYKSVEPPVDIVITDLNMPGMDGIQFIHHVADFGMPVGLILVTAQESVLASVEAMARAYGVNLLAAIKKPVTARTLEAAISRYEPAASRANAAKPAARPDFSLEQIVAGIEAGEFEPFFQPQLALSNRGIRSAEVLPRWRHPSLGIVGAEAFLPTLETSWQIDQLTTVMLRKALPACKAWRVAGVEAAVSVNVSLPSLTDVTLVDRLLETVREAAVDPGHVVFEVTETAAVSDLGKVLENLSRFRMYGFGLSIDDYGSGHSPLEKLARIPVTELKVDQSLVRNAPKKEARRAMLESALEMAKALRSTAIANGVENSEEIVMLREVGYDIVQGSFIAEPMKASDFLRFIVDRKSRTHS